VTVVLRRNETLELSVVEYRDAVTLNELVALTRWQADQCERLRDDTLNIVLPGADFYAVDLGALDALFAHYRELYGELVFEILRRSAWLCQSPAAQGHVDHWLAGRNTRENMSTDVRQFDTFAEAGDWLVLSEAATADMESGVGFIEIARFHAPLEQPRAAAR
jgi:hypothetical protein